ncbi:hypothetical protein BDP81DRAFT_330101 [Colletotrichum phormii]|uniref:Uncharacterized protein n=1 Tax=Colletotrichum phormii TaxID=359342 RepID=A0AAI9ZGY7_9PEZI|nr:uncharacterized protein BDP81DRAFT_330101 [Colletotrichum phormii]KAK1624398.1 hypothetical protein BDP81DRAFT_330101 [Colletotrichum phormii]
MHSRPVATGPGPYNGPGSYPPPPSGAPPGVSVDPYSRPPQSTTPTAPYPGTGYGGPPPGPTSVAPIEHMSGPAAYPNPHSQQASMVEGPRPSATLNPLVTTTQDLKTIKTGTQFALREYLSLQRKRGRLDGAMSLELEDQIRAQGRVLLGDLKVLRKEVGSLIKDGENHRWRNWLIGGAVATFIPAVKRIFRRPSDKTETDVQASNSTEYAFWRSKALVARIKDSLLGRNSFASIAFFVFAVLYVFTNEVSLQVAKTVSKRLKRLSAKIERGDVEVVDQDMKLLEGWRWRVLMWKQ